MRQKFKKIIERLAKKIVHLEQPIHLLAVCTGGRVVAALIYSYLKKKKIRVEYYEVWTDIIKGKAKIWKTNFTKKNYKGTSVIVEDVIWQGRFLPPIKRMLKKMNSQKRIYTISLLDCNHKSDFSIFR